MAFSKKGLESIRLSCIKRRTGKYFTCKKCGKRYYLGKKIKLKTNKGYCSFECQFSDVTLDDLKNKKFYTGHLKFIYNNLLTKYFFEEYYFNQKKSFEQISREFNIGRSALLKYFAKHKLKARSLKEAKVGFVITKVHRRKLMKATAKWKSYKKYRFRSSWEANFAKWCDLSSIKWEYEPKIFNLEDTTYTPDFYLPEFDVWIEIKGWWRRNAKEKFERFKHKYNFNVVLYQRKELKQLGVIQ